MTNSTIQDTTICITPVGIVKNDLLAPPLIARKDGLEHNQACTSAMKDMTDTGTRVSEIILSEEFSELLDGIEEYSHLVILYWGHEVPVSGRTMKKTHPAGMTNYPKQGIYATYSPARPNPVLMTVVQLVKKENNRLYVSGLDAINNSPVLDIKPYVPLLFPQEGVIIPEWMTKIMTEFHS